MGRLYYASSVEVVFDDTVLAHLQVVIGTKLGRNESFFLSWRDPQLAGDGRSSIWIAPAISLRYSYRGKQPPAIDPERVRRMFADSYASGGLQIAGDLPATNPHTQGTRDAF